ncbi:MAG: helicase-related protein, partial [Pseudomonadota bacterium]
MLDAAAPRPDAPEHPRDRTVTAVLGPTNTGKTRYAIERMLAHRSGVIGLPLRLLAREVYDTIVKLRGPSVVALVTGEEKIAPPRAQYWVCTVEAMPLEIGADFVAVDEIQLCADPERGHVFTDRLLNARGLHETLFLGSDAMRGRIADLIPKASFFKRERFSKLTYSGGRKLSRMPSRSAVVGFSVDNVYAVAELMRRQKGGVAVVLGALSPRTRNAQVALYQNGDVDHLVATDAIGMGLNLDVRHVAFAGTRKFDGRRFRELMPHELAQIAGRAGRYTADGTFGVTGEAAPFDEEIVHAIEEHRFAPVRTLMWRNPRLDFGTVDALLASLERAPSREGLARAREADDVVTLRALAEDGEVRAAARGGPAVRRLWEVCQAPDFRKVSDAEHAALAKRIYHFLMEGPARIPSDWLAGQVRRIDRTDGDIDALSKRLAYIRTWTYVANRRDWVESAEEWRETTREVEDRLSDALHQRLTQRFVDRRTSVLMRRLKQKERLVAEVTPEGEVTAEGHALGRLDGFRFTADPAASGDEAKTLRAASVEGLSAEFSRRADRFYNAPDTEIDLTEQGGLMWGEHAVGKLVKSADPLAPVVAPFVDEIAGEDVKARVERRLGHWINRRIAAQFEPLIKLRDDETVVGLARGVAFRLVEALGVVPRSEMAKDVKELDQDGRAQLRKHGVRFGQHTVFLPALLKPAPTRLRIALWALQEDLDEFPTPPPPGLVTIAALPGAPSGFYPRAGYRLAGARALRIDMLERLADMIRGQDARGGFEATADMLSITGCTLEQFADLMRGLGYKADKRERPKPEPAAKETPAEAPDAAADETATAETPAPYPTQTSETEAASETTEAVAAPVEADVSEPVAADAVDPEPESPADAPVPAKDAAANDPAETEAAATDDPEPTDAPAAEAAPDAEPTSEASGEADLQTFYVFTWSPRARQGRGAGSGPRRKGAATPAEDGAQRKGKPPGRRGGKPSDQAFGKGPRKGGPKRDDGPRKFSSGPDKRRSNEPDPDSPF